MFFKQNVRGHSTISDPIITQINASQPPEPVANALTAAYRIMKTSLNQTVSMVLSTEPLPLLATLLLATQLLKNKCATKVILHVKRMPWNVSHVTLADIKTLLSFLADQKSLYNHEQDESSVASSLPDDRTDSREIHPPDTPELAALSKKLTQQLESGALVIKEDPFWTSPFNYEDLPSEAPDLSKEFQEAALVIFAGTGGFEWRKMTGGRKGTGAEEMTETWGKKGWKGRLLLLACGEQGELTQFWGG